MEQIARGVVVIPMSIPNAYLVGDAQNWVLVDSGTPGHEKTIKEAAEAHFGPGAKPRGIVLTHGHFDHAGSSPELAAMWNVNVYAHKLELPYLTGKSKYPPLDTSAPGAFSFLARFMPSRTVNLGSRVREFDGNLSAFGVSGWEAIHTPGHAPGHFCFFRGDGSVLLAGDAISTMNVDSALSLITRKQEVSRPPTPANYDWQQCRESVKKLARLKPSVVAAGHGTPMRDAAAQLQALADHFPIPEYGRYVHQPARVDETGIVYLPPRPPDRLVRGTVGVSAAAAAVGVATLLLYKPKRP
ncbi:MAG TPA: MBL fold metallo-hydrolase [Bryobacteraceae bacterium]|jgi:glyoxylase-like metal-dependent hydrolase (beta-lactamase superfamily II)|nr:MBL fold metallo-hydrolase [Bryobacteraceae bacterium]